MNEDSVVTLVVVSVLWVIFSLMTEERIHPEVMEEAVRLCENNQGLDYIEADIIKETRSFHGNVICNDGFQKDYNYYPKGEKE